MDAPRIIPSATLARRISLTGKLWENGGDIGRSRQRRRGPIRRRVVSHVYCATRRFRVALYMFVATERRAVRLGEP